MRDFTEDELKRFSKAIDTLSKDAESKVWQVFNRLGFYGDKEVAEAVLVDAMCLVIDQYGDSIGTAIAEWIEAEYVGPDGIDPKALVVHDAAMEALAAASPTGKPKVASYVRQAMRFSGDSKAARAAAGRQAAAYAASEAKRRGYDVIDRTITRADATAKQLGMSPLGLQVIWKPQSATPCAFCTMLASNSWRVASKATLGQYKEHIHPHCSCVLVFKPPEAAVGGITPKKYLERMNSVIETDANGTEYVMTSDGRRINHYRADGKVSDGYWDEVTNALRRKDYQNPEVRDLLQEQHREQYRRTHEQDDE